MKPEQKSRGSDRVDDAGARSDGRSSSDRREESPADEMMKSSIEPSNNLESSDEPIVAQRLARAERETFFLRHGLTPPRSYEKISLRDCVFIEADGRCEFVDAESGRRCTSRYAPQVDHVEGFACGGSDERENFRLLCWSHNQYEARRRYGDRKTHRRNA